MGRMAREERVRRAEEEKNAPFAVVKEATSSSPGTRSHSLILSSEICRKETQKLVPLRSARSTAHSELGGHGPPLLPSRNTPLLQHLCPLTYNRQPCPARSHRAPRAIRMRRERVAITRSRPVTEPR